MPSEEPNRKSWFEYNLALRPRDADLLITFELGDSVPAEEVFHCKSRLDLDLGPAEKETAVAILSG